MGQRRPFLPRLPHEVALPLAFLTGAWRLGPPPSPADMLASGFGREFWFEFEYDQAMMM
jgi:hypothetical protein